jgi:DNA-binding CsgD family transcriptional regulator
LYEAGALATLSWLPYLPLRRAFAHDFEGDAAYVGTTVEAELGEALLFMDDLQWADTQTAALLPLLTGRIALVAAVRRGDPSTPAALDAAAAAGAELLPLEPLPEAEAAELARALHPELSETATRRLVERSGGNPFLLEQLAATGEPSDSLRLTLAARVRALTPAGRDAIAALALLGRPAQPRMLGTGAAEIVAAGLATANGEVTIRHALLAETTSETLTPEERVRIHSRLAAALDDPGEAARHHAAAGESELAYTKAMDAVDRAGTPGERASHLSIAAECAAGEEVHRLRVRAGGELVQAGDYAAAARLLEGTAPRNREFEAEAALLQWKAYWGLGEPGRGRAAWERAAALAIEPELRVRVRLEEVDVALYVEDDPALALEKATAAYELAHRLGVHEPMAARRRGHARLTAGMTGWEEDLALASHAGLAHGDLDTGFGAGSALVFGLRISGRPLEGRHVAERLAARAGELKLAGWERRFRSSLAGFHWHAGAFSDAVAVAAAVLEEAPEQEVRGGALYYLCQALVDLGRFTEAESALEALRRQEGTEHDRRHRLCAEAELHYWSGRLTAALGAADECLAAPAHPSEGPPLFVRLTRCWTCVELGLDPGPPYLQPLFAMGKAMPVEEEALVKLAAGDELRAAELFERAARLWAGRHARGELRCLWGTGEALRRAGRDRRAVERLLEAEARAAELDHRPLVGKIRRSLRLAGVHRAVEKTNAGVLTGREAEALELVAQGLTNDEIARRLGLGRPTVVRLIRSAQQKLGATNRTQAAALAARQ